MRTCFLVALLSCAFSLVGQVEPDVHHRARIFYETPEQLSRLDQLGVAVDHGFLKPGHSLVCDFSERDLAIVTAEGLRYEIMIKDVGQYYRDRNNPASVHYAAPAVPQKNVNCTEEGVTYPTPTNYHAGSMGGFLTYAEMLAELDEMYAYSEANNLGIITQRAENINPDDPDDLKTFEGRYQQWVMISNNAEAPS
ncbi:MAG: hypothetical protein AAF597_18100, partial [Bacteroidota bacterium]